MGSDLTARWGKPVLPPMLIAAVVNTPSSIRGSAGAGEKDAYSHAFARR